VDWARRASDAVIVVVMMLAGAGMLLFGVGVGPPLVHAVRDNASLVLFALGGVVLGGGVATRLARA
jgi:hypothetical protein